jgi:hypothetical protein
MSGQMYCWQDDSGSWKIGRVELSASRVLQRSCIISFALMRHYHTGQCELVREDVLLPYPQAKIEEPSK